MADKLKKESLLPEEILISESLVTSLKKLQFLSHFLKEISISESLETSLKEASISKSLP